MAKGAVEGLVRPLGADPVPQVRVNSIAGSHALQRPGEPEDLAELAALRLQPQADWIGGQVLGCDTGRSSLRTKG
jgi:NAD(P)-dependent dehydrogenase (short-subunit alcohol dehydrogenase family)